MVAEWYVYKLKLNKKLYVKHNCMENKMSLLPCYESASNEHEIFMSH